MKAIVIFVFLGLFVIGVSVFALAHESSHHSSPKGDLGVIHFPTSGNREAQGEFLNGVLLLHNFQYDDAKESFLKAQKSDPEFAMAYWGEAMTENHPLWQEQDRQEALHILSRLGPTPEARQAKSQTDREKRYLQAVEILYGDGTKEARDLAYSQAMGKLAAKYPEDLEAAAFYALSILGSVQGERDFRVYMKAASVAEAVFQKNPSHPGAVHYLIHSYDDPIHAPLGLRPARVYTSIASAASHAQHMPSHIFMALGMWEEVVKANEASWAASEERIKRKGLSMGHRDYHSLYWLEYAYLQLGRFQKAKDLVRLVEQDAAETNSRTTRGYLASMQATYIIETQEWKPNTPEGTRKSLRFSAATSSLFANGMSAVKTNQIDLAKEALEALTTLVESSKNRLSPSQVQAGRIMEKELHGLILLAQGKTQKALEEFKAGTHIEDRMPYAYGPPFPIKPSHELLGEVFLELGQLELAHHHFAQALAGRPQKTLSRSGAEKALSQDHQ